MNSVDPDHWAVVLKVVPGGEEEISEGTVHDILQEFTDGGIGRPGGFFMRLEGRADLILGRQLQAMVDELKASRESNS